MAALPETNTFPEEIYQIEQTDPVLGGAPNEATGAGMDNIPHQQLAKRTRWLKTRVDALLGAVVAATSSVAGIVKLSTAINSTSTTTAATPSAVKAAYDNAEGRALKATTLVTSGLATGGGDLSANRTITVAAATQAEAEAGISNTKAMTPAGVVQALNARGLGASPLLISDWDAALTTGNFMGSNALNAPGADWFAGEVLAHNQQWLTQTVWAFSSDGASDTKTYRRERNNGIWGAWYRLRVSQGEQATLWAAVNTTFTGTGLATGGGSLAENRSINVPAATQAEAEAGISSTTAMTPQRVAQAIVAKIASYAPTSRTIGASGLATGGGDLSANRTITVLDATQAEAEAGTTSSKAMSPLRVTQAIAARLAGVVKIGTQLVVGHGSGAVALTVNDSAGNASLCFNHAGGLPDQNGNSGRITVNTDMAVSSQIDFSVASGVVAGVAPTMINMLRMTEGGTVLLRPLIGGNGAGSGGNLLQSMGAGLPPAWVNRKYVSPKTVIANATNYTFSHGLGEMPAIVSVSFECVVAHGGYVPGDVIEIGISADAEGANEGFGVKKTASQLVVMIGDNGPGGYTRATGGGSFYLPADHWKMIVTAIL